MDERIFIAVPTYNNTVHMRCMIGVASASQARLCRVAVHGSSLLANGFNKLWLQAIDSGCEWAGMVHADVGPAAGWADVMIDEMNEHEADFISAVIPIKNEQGVYSTALAEVDRPAHYVLKHEDLVQLPLTFGAEELHQVTGHTGCLCVNTGLWVCRMTAEWVRQVSFCVKTWIDWRADPPVARCIPEDWDFSQQLHKLGVKVVATTAVSVCHCGEWEWRLDSGQQDQAPLPTLQAAGGGTV